MHNKQLLTCCEGRFFAWIMGIAIVLSFATFIAISFQLESVGSSKILALLTVASPSHHIFNRELVKALASRGHQVTVFSPNFDKDSGPNLTYIQAEGVYEALKERYGHYEDFAEESTIDKINFAFDWALFCCEKSLQSKGAQKLINAPPSEKFDLVIAEDGFAECTLGFVAKFGYPPIVGISAFGLPAWTATMLGTPENPSFMPSFVLPYSAQMSFSERVHNFLTHNYLMYFYHYTYIPKQEAIAKKYFKEELPSFLDIHKNYSIVLVNTAFGLEDARPVSPNFIPIGGMHINPNPRTLPKDLKMYLDEAEEGFIYFSLGSNLHSDALPENKRKAILEAFSELPVRILWKFESDVLPGQPPNVRIGKWLPQSDILAHPNIKMFISHCGKMSTTEASYRGVPIVGIPFFVDQFVNLKTLMARGVAVHLDYKTLTKHTIIDAVKAILNNDSYHRNAKKLSAIYRDYPQGALDRAVFWTEYTIRHGAATHLKPVSTQLYWYQYFLLDVLLALSGAVVLLLCIMLYILKSVFSLFTSKSKGKQKLHLN